MKQKHMLNTLKANKANTPVYTRVFDIQVKYIKTAQQHLKAIYPLHTTQSPCKEFKMFGTYSKQYYKIDL